MKKYSSYCWFIIILIALSLSGCVFFRILEVRDQLKNFNENFAIEDKKGLELIFKKPVLTSGDIILIMKSEPTKVKSNENNEFFTYVLVKRYKKDDHDLKAKEKGNFDIEINMGFTQGKLSSMTFPERFLKYFSKSAFARFMSSMGDTDVKKLNKTAKSSITDVDYDELPSIDNIEDVLGKPYSSETGNEKLLYTYKYKTIPNDEESRPLKLKYIMYFNSETEKLDQIKAKISGINININFLNTSQ